MNQNTIASLDAHLTYIPFSHIDMSETRYRFRLPDAGAVLELGASLTRSGQTHPALLEKTDAERYVILDGHRRADAIRGIHASGGTWHKLLAHVVSSHKLTPIARFRLLRERHLSGKDSLGLIERGRFFRSFVQQGVSVHEAAQQCAMTINEIEDLIELAGVPANLAWLLNRSRLDPTLALMLARRYHGWSQGQRASHALRAAQRLVGHAHDKRPSMKAWRFLLDFYWIDGRPFMSFE